MAPSQNHSPSRDASANDGLAARWSRRLAKRRRKAVIKRLRRLPRHQPGSSSILQRSVQYADAASFVAQYDEIWKREIYRLPHPESIRSILDCGANIGMGTLYFAVHYPNASIVSFEPDPKIFDLLQRNCDAWNVDHATLVNAAVWTSEAGGLQFASEGADSGSLIEGQSQHTGDVIEVPAKRLRDYLDQPIDLLKMDIEGAEVAVLEDCDSSLQQVKNLFVEYHSFCDQEQQLDRILTLLKRVGFRTHVDSGMVSPQPFVSRQTFNGMDQYLNIYGYRE
jgi:FkbM family methyltransferase